LAQPGVLRNRSRSQFGRHRVRSQVAGGAWRSGSTSWYKIME